MSPDGDRASGVVPDPLGGLVGIDTIRIRVPIDGCLPDRVRLPGGGYVTPYWPFHADIEASLPRRAFGHNARSLPLDLLDDALWDLLAEADQHVGLPVQLIELDTIPVRRIDVVRDFSGVPDIAQVLAALRSVPRSRTRTVSWIESKSPTLSVRTKRWRYQLYDKGAEAPRDAANGHLRFEYAAWAQRLDSAWARTNGGIIRVVGDLRPIGKLETLASQAFCDASFDAPVSGDLWARLAHTELTVSKQCAVYGWACLRSVGRQPALSRNTEAEYRRILNRLPPCPGDAVLDWRTGALRRTAS